jgi:hypothetical protein
MEQLILSIDYITKIIDNKLIIKRIINKTEIFELEIDRLTCDESQDIFHYFTNGGRKAKNYSIAVNK